MPGRPGSHHDVSVQGWTEWEQPGDTLWYEVPAGTSIQDHVDPANVEGVWVHAANARGGPYTSDEHWFWVRTMYPFDTWDEWDTLIDAALDQHNMAMA